jgi:hypothetical protein
VFIFLASQVFTHMATYRYAIILYSIEHAHEKLLSEYQLQENPWICELNYFLRCRGELDGRSRNER